MSAFERDLQSVLADQGHVSDPQLVSSKASHSIQAAWRTSLTTALGARARPSELFAGEAAAHAVFPNDFHHLTFAVDVDGSWKRVGVLQVGA